MSKQETMFELIRRIINCPSVQPCGSLYDGYSDYEIFYLSDIDATVVDFGDHFMVYHGRAEGETGVGRHAYTKSVKVEPSSVKVVRGL